MAARTKAKGNATKSNSTKRNSTKSSSIETKPQSSAKIALIFTLIISLALNAVFMFVVGMKMVQYNELSQELSDFQKKYKVLEDEHSKVSSELKTVNDQYKDLYTGKSLNLKNNEYTVFAAKIGDKVGDFTVKEILPFSDGGSITDWSSIVVFEGVSVITGDFEYNAESLGGPTICLVNLTPESETKIPRAVDIMGQPKSSDVSLCFYDEESIKLFNGKQSGGATIKISGYSDLFCDCDQPNFRGPKIVEVLTLS